MYGTSTLFHVALLGFVISDALQPEKSNWES